MPRLLLLRRNHLPSGKLDYSLHNSSASAHPTRADYPLPRDGPPPPHAVSSAAASLLRLGSRRATSSATGAGAAGPLGLSRAAPAARPPLRRPIFKLSGPRPWPPVRLRIGLGWPPADPPSLVAAPLTSPQRRARRRPEPQPPAHLRAMAPQPRRLPPAGCASTRRPPALRTLAPGHPRSSLRLGASPVASKRGAPAASRRWPVAGCLPAAARLGWALALSRRSCPPTRIHSDYVDSRFLILQFMSNPALQIIETEKNESKQGPRIGQLVVFDLEWRAGCVQVLDPLTQADSRPGN
ncbi:hypothetical protein BS78_09G150300 [Paspalum vaginatum]|nr:hypothetical protein BS78_09G150300 [Paspalum vaginatum]